MVKIVRYLCNSLTANTIKEIAAAGKNQFKKNVYTSGVNAILNSKQTKEELDAKLRNNPAFQRLIGSPEDGSPFREPINFEKWLKK